MGVRQRARYKFNRMIREWYRQMLIPRCVHCGHIFFTKHNLSVDHVIPLSKGGNNNKGNLVPACIDCNRKRGNNKVALKYYKFFNMKEKTNDRDPVIVSNDEDRDRV